ncbi:MAG: DUF5777 family beta-barrel protein [Pyrinomonadaceae bacterium]
MNKRVRDLGWMILHRAIFLLAITLFIASFSLGQTTDPSSNPKAVEAPTKTEPSSDPPKDVEVKFDSAAPDVVIVEIGGRKVRVNTTTREYSELTQESSESVVQSESSTPEESVEDFDEEEEGSVYDFDSGYEPFDYRLVNVPTPKKVPKGTWNMVFTHRFSQPVRPFGESGRQLLGFDSFSVSSFGINYGITDKLYLSAYRSPLSQYGISKTIELGIGYHVTDQTKKSPVAMNLYASVEGNDNFTDKYTYNFQAMFSRHFGKRVYTFFSPAFHLDSNGQRRFNPRAEDYFPPAEAANTFNLPSNTTSFGMGTAVMITPNLVAMFEFTPRIGFKWGRVDPVFDENFEVIGFTNESYPEVGFGLQKNLGKHSFAITFSNTQGTTTSRYNSSNNLLKPSNYVIGFNLSRRW